MSRAVRRAIIVLALVGFASAATSTYVHYQLAQDPGVHQLLRHQRERQLYPGLPQPLRVGRRHSGGAAGCVLVRPGPAADGGRWSRIERALREHRWLPAGTLDARAFGRAVSWLRLFHGAGHAVRAVHRRVCRGCGDLPAVGRRRVCTHAVDPASRGRRSRTAGQDSGGGGCRGRVSGADRGRRSGVSGRARCAGRSGRGVRPDDRLCGCRLGVRAVLGRPAAGRPAGATRGGAGTGDQVQRL